MTTTNKRRGQRASAPAIRVGIEDLLKAKVSMLGEAMLPAGYSDLDNDYAIRDHVFGTKEDPRVVRLNIVWDLPADALEEVERVLDSMRERGAAMVIAAEEVKS